jgi:1-acyl-sn-glycerol-3-phosphate acyltransferase
MKYTIFDTPILRPFLHYLAMAVLKISGWRKEGQVPDFPKFVAISAPHTSNWDLLFALLLAFAFDIKISFMGKNSLFRPPFGALFKWLGGIPIDRGKPTGMVEKSIEAFHANEKMILVIAPEGTRTRAARWRSGFYHIARGAQVPIVLAYLDYGRKAGGIGPAIIPTGDIEGDMKQIRTFYAHITPKHPERMRQSMAHESI